MGKCMKAPSLKSPAETSEQYMNCSQECMTTHKKCLGALSHGGSIPEEDNAGPTRKFCCRTTPPTCKIGCDVAEQEEIDGPKEKFCCRTQPPTCDGCGESAETNTKTV